MARNTLFSALISAHLYISDLNFAFYTKFETQLQLYLQLHPKKNVNVKFDSLCEFFITKIAISD